MATGPLSLGELKHLWLDSQGGRSEKDILYDEKGEYVLMSKKRVYIPKNLKGHLNSIRQIRLDPQGR